MKYLYLYIYSAKITQVLRDLLMGTMSSSSCNKIIAATRNEAGPACPAPHQCDASNFWDGFLYRTTHYSTRLGLSQKQ